MPAGPRLAHLDHVVVAITDWERSNRFYAEVLGAELVRRGQGWAYRLGEQQLNVHGPGVSPFRWAYRLGEQQLNVHGPGVSPFPVAQVPVTPGNSDLCFVWPGTIGDAVAHLERHDVEIEEGPVERDGARGSGRSVYFRDPDGSLLELISYEPG